MVSSKMMHHLATHPQDYMRWQATGKMPPLVRPSGPLIDLLRKISPRDLEQLRGVTVNATLGYNGSHQFQFGAQALRWIAPEGDHLRADWPAESWRLKQFAGPVYLEDMLAACANYPEGLAAKYPRLCRRKASGSPSQK